MDGSWGYYAKWNSHMEKDKTMWFYSKVAFKKKNSEQNKNKFIDTKNN